MIILADLHLGKVQDTIDKNGKPSRAVDTVERLKEAILFAHDESQAVVLAGDIFDSTHPSPWMIDLLFSALKFAKKKMVQVYIIPGNHDCGVVYSSLDYVEDLFDCCLMVTMPKVINLEGKRVLFLPHVVRQTMEKMNRKYGSYTGYVQNYLDKKEINSVDYIIGHAHVSGAKNSSDIEIEAGDALHFDPSEYPKYKKAVFGHIHKHQFLKNGKVAYTGSVVTNSFDEAELEKGFIKLDDDEFIHVPFATPVTEYKHIVIDLISKDTINLEEKLIQSLVQDKLVKISAYAKDPMQIDMQHIRSVFDQFGKVVRFETIIGDDPAMIEEEAIDDDVFTDINFQAVFKSWVNDKELVSAKEKKNAIAAADEIITEVLDAERNTD
jgi:DNA repair exonuclease SbcCD nuclease subunit